MSDKLHRFLLENLHVRGEWVSLESSWQEIQKTANYPEPVRHVLGEALAAISLLAESLKFDGSLIFQIRGTHPVTMLVVQATSTGGLRGIAHWDGDIPEKATFNELFGSGTIIISVEPSSTGKGKRYQSLIALQGDSLADCLKDYFEQSEQLKTQLWLAADDEKVAGLMLQALPIDHNKEHQDKEQSNEEAGWQHATVLANTIKDQELLDLDAKTLLHRLYHEDDVRLFDANPLRFECTCSQAKIDNAIRSMGEAEAMDIIKEQGSISVDCEFCNTHYALDKIDVDKLFVADDVTIIPSSLNNSGNSVH